MIEMLWTVKVYIELRTVPGYVEFVAALIGWF